MDIKEFAKSISGKEYGYPQFTKEEIETAKENGFVIVYGYSDDLMEFEGAIEGEADCYLGGGVCFNKLDIIRGRIILPSSKVTAIWNRDEDENGNLITWTYETSIPHETFMIYECTEPYCRGIVFRIEDVR